MENEDGRRRALKTRRQAKWRAGVAARAGKPVSASTEAKISPEARDDIMRAFPPAKARPTKKSERQARWRRRSAGAIRCVVYILQCQAFYKIGRTTTGVVRRLDGLRTGNPFQTTVIHQFETSKPELNSAEMALHDLFACYRLERSEWFTLSPEAVEFICSITADNYNEKLGVQCLQTN